MSASKNTIVKDAISLTVITLVAGLLLAFVNMLTAPVIAEQKAEETRKAYASVYTDAANFKDDKGEFASVEETSKALLEEQAGITNVTINQIFGAYDSSDNLIGYVFKATSSEGYGGDVPISLGIDLSGTITGLEVLGNSETEGFGANASKPEFKDQFKGMNAPEISFVKDGSANGTDQINGVSGASKTSSAVVKAVNSCLYYAKNCIGN